MTNDLDRRLREHKARVKPSFTNKYACTDLVYFEDTPSIQVAIEKEKQLKRWSRDKKEKLILTHNPLNQDLSTSVEMTE